MTFNYEKYLKWNKTNLDEKFIRNITHLKLWRLFKNYKIILLLNADNCRLYCEIFLVYTVTLKIVPIFKTNLIF